MHTLYIMSGLPYSGKTYLAKKISEKTNVTLIAYDAIWEEMNKKLDTWLSWDQVTKIAHQRINEALSQEKSVVYDNLGDTRWYRDELKELAEKNNADAQIIFLDIPQSVRLARYEENHLNPSRHHVSKKRFNRSSDEYESPVRDENPIIIRSESEYENLLTSLNSSASCI